MVVMEGPMKDIRKGMHNVKRGMEFVIEQVDKLEQNLQVDPAHQPLPSKPPVHSWPPGPGGSLPWGFPG
eukprot:12093598-Prorocentrum_lima.AAC.1